jgi:hypothetical protein
MTDQMLLVYKGCRQEHFKTFITSLSLFQPRFQKNDTSVGAFSLLFFLAPLIDTTLKQSLTEKCKKKDEVRQRTPYLQCP